MTYPPARLPTPGPVDRARSPGETELLIYVYLFSLIVGGILLGASILLGGQDTDVDADGDLDVDGDLDADADADHGDVGGFFYSFLSMRFWVFFLAFFGLTGITLDGLNLVGAWWFSLLLAIGMGTASGLAAVKLIRRLGSGKEARVVSNDDYVGKTARVLVPFEGERVGKVRVELRGNTIDLLASGLDGEGYGGADEVLIVEMEGTRARVARMDKSNEANG